MLSRVFTFFIDKNVEALEGMSTLRPVPLHILDVYHY